jgi:hypothetical protein
MHEPSDAEFDAVERDEDADKLDDFTLDVHDSEILQPTAAAALDMHDSEIPQLTAAAPPTMSHDHNFTLDAHHSEISQPTVKAASAMLPAMSHDHEHVTVAPSQASESEGTCSAMQGVGFPAQNQPATWTTGTEVGPEISTYASTTPQQALQVGSRGQRLRKTRIFDLNACECGHEISSTEIENRDTVMQCKVPGCETVWVSRPQWSSCCKRDADEFGPSQYHRECMNYDIVPKNWSCPSCKASTKRRRT